MRVSNDRLSAIQLPLSGNWSSKFPGGHILWKFLRRFPARASRTMRPCYREQSFVKALKHATKAKAYFRVILVSLEAQ